MIEWLEKSKQLNTVSSNSKSSLFWAQADWKAVRLWGFGNLKGTVILEFHPNFSLAKLINLVPRLDANLGSFEYYFDFAEIFVSNMYF